MAIVKSFERVSIEILQGFVEGVIGTNSVFERAYQAIPGNDQNASPTNQKTAGSKLDRTS